MHRRKTSFSYYLLKYAPTTMLMRHLDWQILLQQFFITFLPALRLRSILRAQFLLQQEYCPRFLENYCFHEIQSFTLILLKFLRQEIEAMQRQWHVCCLHCGCSASRRIHSRSRRTLAFVILGLLRTCLVFQ